MFSRLLVFLSAITLLGLSPATADNVERVHGGDIYVAGTGPVGTLDAPRDVFGAGRTVTLKGDAQGDITAAGFHVEIEAAARKDVFAAGGTVTLRAPVGEDLSAAGFSVRTTSGATVAGNARLAGGTVVVDGPVSGALAAFGGEVVLNAPVTGDAWIVADTISFGPDAVVSGNLTYSSEEKMSVPDRVASADRVAFEKIDRAEMYKEARDAWDDMEYPVLPGVMSMFATFLITLAFFVVLGAIFLTFLPKPVERMRGAIFDRPGMIFLTGVVGLSMLFGMVPIIALTIVGLPFIPIVLLAIIVAWTLGYALGAYAIAMRVWAAFSDDADPSKTTRLLILAAAVTLIAVLNFIPFLGWMANYTLVLLGIGAMTNAVFDRMIGNPGYAADVDMKPIEPSKKGD